MAGAGLSDGPSWIIAVRMGLIFGRFSGRMV